MEEGKRNFKTRISKVRDIKLKYGSANIDSQMKYIFATLHYPIFINFRKINRLDYDRLMKNFHFEINRIIYRVVGNTTENFGFVTGPEYSGSSHISKSLLTIDLTLKNNFSKLGLNEPMLKDVIEKMIDYINTKTKYI